jgi:diguanylate cyclase (GGDEF)-like protein/PAS domain S-box-containing protein
MSGLDLCAAIRAIDPDVFLILLTGHASLDTAIAAVGQIDQFLTKPAPPEELVAAVRAGAERSTGRRTERRAAAHAATRLAAIIEGTDDAVIAMTLDGTITGWNRGAEAIYGYPAGHAIGRPAAMLVPPDQPDDLPALLADIRSGQHVEHFETIRMRADASQLHVSLTVSPIHDSTGNVIGASSIARDISDRLAADELRQQLEAELRRQASHDPLTGLANRSLFVQRLAHATQRRDPRSLVVLFVDLDGFKDVNDSYGHSAGDLVLQAVATGLTGCLRPEDTVSRFGGDEFVILLEDSDLPTALGVVDRVQRWLTQPIQLPDAEVVIHASIGLAVSAQPHAPVEQVIADADAAMYAAKVGGQDRCEVFDPTLRVAIEQRAQLRLEIDRALADHAFCLRYQPIVDLRTGAQAGVEALIRWNHPTRGLLAPAEFIDDAESSGQITAIGASVIDLACREVAGRGDRLNVSVNVSPRELLRPDLVEVVVAALAKYGLAGDRLTLEITESATITDPRRAMAQLVALKAAGVRLALDDFGTGYSSLSHLREFPVDYLKIDRSFVAEITARDEDKAIVRGVVAIAHALGIQTIAEGVENPEQRAVLLDLGCTFGQGYFWSRPVVLAEVGPAG